MHNERRGTERGGQDVQTRFVKHADHLAEQHIHPAGALINDGVEPEEPSKCQKQRDGEEHRKERDNGGEKNAHMLPSDLQIHVLGLLIKP